MKRKLYYLSHQIATAGDFEENILNLNAIAELMLMKGYMLINPAKIIESTGMNDEEDRHRIMAVCTALVAQCDCLIICSDISDGVWEEIAFAKEFGIPIITLGQVMPELTKRRSLK